ncbi:dienelactone hydrolase family protein [Planctomicrobium sp. SH668]|uniref:carboxylesterase family protein n=1 Tax=Planctomicrobium sp. SH668 TaxID=3448126 RepID=UPI003F5C6486
MSVVRADDVDQLFESKIFVGKNGVSIPYRLLSPATIDPGKKYPVVLFLHGAGERGDNNESQLVHVAREFARSPQREQHPAFVVCPQCPHDHKWVEVPWEDGSHVMPESPSAPLSLVVELMDSLPEELPIDTNRTYYVGLSMGGFGVWDLLSRQSEKCAGAVAICGGGDTARAPMMKSVPIWAFHGDQDVVVKVHRSRDMVAAVEQAGGTIVYTEYPGVNHNSWTATAANRLVWDWLFSQTR